MSRNQFFNIFFINQNMGVSVFLRKHHIENLGVKELGPKAFSTGPGKYKKVEEI